MNALNFPGPGCFDGYVLEADMLSRMSLESCGVSWLEWANLLHDTRHVFNSQQYKIDRYIPR